MITIISFILVLSVLVFVHELGHFWTARRFGVKAEEFGFGFPPRALGIYKSKNGKWKKVRGNKEVDDAVDTIYSFNWIPIGGFVKIKGEDGPSGFENRISQNNEEEKKKEVSDSLEGKPIWQRMIIMSAGVAMNLVLAAVLISIGLMVGFPQAVDNLRPGAKISETNVQIAQVLPDSAAQKAGLKMSDTILGIDGQKFSDDQGIIGYLEGKEGETLNYHIKRAKEEFFLDIQVGILEETGQAGVGIALVTTALVQYPWYLAVWEGVSTTFYLTGYIIGAFAVLIKDLVTGQGVGVELAGPIGIADMTGQYARMGFIYLLQFTALLSINLAVINFLPFPALDGGHVVFLIIEKIKGSPVRKELAQKIHGAGLALLMILVLFITFKELIGKIFT